MALAPSISSPTLRVYQLQRTQTQVFQTPSLGAFIMGPCYEIVNAFNEDGTSNSKAKFCPYTQLPLLITKSAFPSPRNNIAQVVVQNEFTRIFNSFGDSITELPMNPGSAFMLSYNKATRALVRSSSSATFNVAGTTLVLSIDNPLRANTAPDISITFTGTNPLTNADVVSQINTAVGFTLATSITISPEVAPRVQMISPTYGAKSSITVRGGGSANTLLGFNTQEQRVEGSGFRGQEDNFGNDTLSPCIEWFRGQYLQNAVVTTFPVGLQFGQADEDGVFINGQTAAVTFGSGGTLDLRVGDEMYADGILVNSGEVMKVESSRFKIGTINTSLSTYDTTGKLVTAVRDQTQVRLLTDPVPFAPRYSWFKAKYINVNVAGTKAILTGTKSGTPAEAATIASTSAPTGPFNLTGLNLKVTVTTNDVEGSEQTFNFVGGPFADMNAVVSAIGSNITGVVATNDSGKLRLSTTLVGKAQAIKLAATSTANSTLNFSTGSDTTDIGKDVEFPAMPANLLSSAIAFPITLAAADTLSIEISTDGGGTYPTTKTHTSLGATYGSITALVAALQGDAGFVGTDLVVSASTSTVLSIKSVLTGELIVLRVKVGSTAVSPTKINYTIGQTDAGEDEINGKNFKFQLNDRSKIYFVTFTSNSLVDAYNLINEAVGTTVGSAGGVSLDKLTLTSPLKGYASKVKVVAVSDTLKAINSFGFVAPNDVAQGNGRPDPDAYLDVDGNIHVSGELLRNPVTGYPYDPASSCFYIQYKGLRLDVTSEAFDPGILSYFDPLDVEEQIGPITPENPLAFGFYMELLNAPNTIVRGLGIDEISAAYPEGTPEAYTRALKFTEQEDDYTFVPLSQNEAVHRLFDTHVTEIHDPDKEGNAQKPRRARISPLVPTRANNKLVSSGLSANTPVATTNQINLDVNPSTALLALGINPALPIPYSAQVFLEFTVGTSVRNYSVSAVNGVNVTLRTTFANGENTDGFFSTTTLTEVVVNADWEMSIRGAKLLLPGSNKPDYRKIAETINEYAQTYKNRRISYDFPDKAKVILNGVTLTVPGYYHSCIAAGARAYNAPQQSLSNFILKGAIGRTDAKYYTEGELDIIAGGGVAIWKADKEEFPVYMRHQLTTDVSSVEVQEESIGCCLDIVEKLARQRLSKYLGNRNIDSILLDELATIIDGMKRFLIDDVGCLEDFKVVSLARNPVRKDGVIMEVSVTPFYPLNEIKFYIYF